MLINFSKTSFNEWSDKQLEICKKYGSILDERFPYIYPDMDYNKVIDLCEHYRGVFMNLLGKNPVGEDFAVLVDADLSTFSYNLIAMLKEMDFLVVQATTKTSSSLRADNTHYFYDEFVMLREY